MSNFVRKLKPSFVSYEALEVACHALETYQQRLKDPEEVEKLKVLINFKIMELFSNNKSLDTLLQSYSGDTTG